MYYNNIFLRPLELKHINQDYLNWFKDKNVQKFIIKSKINTINDLKRYIQIWESPDNLILITHYVVISEILNKGVSSGEIIITDKNFNNLGSFLIR